MIFVQLRYTYRLDPTPAQRRGLARAFGCARVVFNDAIAARRDAREAGAPFPTDAVLSKALTQAKRTPERAWLGGGTATGVGGREHRVPQLVRLGQGRAEGPQAGRAAVPVPQGPGAVDPVHQGAPV